MECLPLPIVIAMQNRSQRPDTIDPLHPEQRILRLLRIFYPLNFSACERFLYISVQTSLSRFFLLRYSGYSEQIMPIRLFHILSLKKEVQL